MQSLMRTATKTTLCILLLSLAGVTLFSTAAAGTSSAKAAEGGKANVDVYGTELSLPDIVAFAIGTDVNIKSVRAMETDSFNVILRAAQERGEPWTDSFILTALRFTGSHLYGSRQSVNVQIEPSEWEEGRPLRFARVTIEDKGWLDDSVYGERYVVWLTKNEAGRLEVRRALWAELCSRMYWKFYSADLCP